MAQKTLKEWWGEKTQKQKIWIVVGCGAVLGILGNITDSTPSACDCYDILNIPTKKVGYKMFPRELLGDEEYKKWQDCYDKYAGPAGAYLKCNK